MLQGDQRKVLIAPLDWGLGHATRCIPLIHELLHAGFKVIIAADGRSRVLLENEFPLATFLNLKGYNIQYSKTGVGLFFRLIGQISKIISIIRYEHNWLNKIIDDHGIDLVISDNRYGLHSQRIPCVFITHQLRIQSPIFGNVLQRLNYHYINQFTECWIPDYEELPGLGGNLSHPQKMPSVPTRYIGPLSRFAFERGVEKHVLILLSGPEPQRSLLEKKILAQIKNCSEPVVLVRGLPGSAETLSTPSNVKVFNHLPALALQELIKEASFVVARSGYSTVMDLVRMHKKGVLIPTPGQTEQEYLADHLNESRIAFFVRQANFDWKQALNAASSFSYKLPAAGKLTSGAEKELAQRIFRIIEKEK